MHYPFLVKIFYPRNERKMILGSFENTTCKGLTFMSINGVLYYKLVHLSLSASSILVQCSKVRLEANP
jgi:hypothetical protein